MKRRTLYVTDLDGTLLRKDEKVSEYTCKVLNDLMEKGLVFSYATARSIYSASVVTKGLKVNNPVIVYNGAIILDANTWEIHSANFFEEDIKDAFIKMFSKGVYPIVYSFIDGKEKFSYIDRLCSPQTKDFLTTRSDVRKNPVDTLEELIAGDIFYITCIDEEKKLFPIYEKYKDKYHCVYQKDIYSGEQWLEIMPLLTTKAQGIMKLKEMLKCHRIVAFGDGINDIEMFETADECYAVSNAVDELKTIATGVIDSNNEDGIAKWIRKRVLEEE